MERFRTELDQRNPKRGGRRRWIFVPYDQLTDEVGPLGDEPPEELGIVVVECPWKAARRPYHRQKLGLVLSSLRHFALEQAERGVQVRHVVADGPYRSALAPLADEVGPLRVMRPAERELREDLAPLVASGRVEYVAHEGWLTSRGDFGAALPEPPYRMDTFYRHVRRRTGILMDDGRPRGGRFSFDGENRKPWKGEPPTPEPIVFGVDPIDREVERLIESRYSDHPGRLDLSRLPTTKADVDRLWEFARSECLPHFGPYEDAMSTRSRHLFHTQISPLLNLHRLLPGRVVDDALRLDLPLPSIEGFVRQVLGWREFVRHVHEATDGFRTTQEGNSPNHLGAATPLPPAYWGEKSGLHCLDTVVESVWEEGYSHHITRLMVLSNLASLLDVSPRELSDWFWVAYIDAYDWVVEPNVLAMGTFATGDLMTTKPYVSGSAYIDRMSDYCGPCRFHPKKTCPITSLYWDYLGRHAEALRGNPRLTLPLRSQAKRTDAQKAADRRTFEEVRETLLRGETLGPG
ncbi:MAG: cryptochrome/photolyase family protein [Candidatus Eisenbacteria bacterium]